MRERDKKVIHVDDYVFVNNPLLFIRCGYPLTLKTALDDINKYDEQIYDFLNGIMGVENPLDPTLQQLEERVYETAVDKVRYAIAYQVLKEKQFGGKKRSVYTKKDDKFHGSIGKVVSIKYVNSGTYNHGSVYNHWEEDYYYSGPYLSDQKTHKILDVWFEDMGECIKIESIHVDKLFNYIPEPNFPTITNEEMTEILLKKIDNIKEPTNWWMK
jgi:hypothetical protein